MFRRGGPVDTAISVISALLAVGLTIRVWPPLSSMERVVMVVLCAWMIFAAIRSIARLRSAGNVEASSHS